MESQIQKIRSNLKFSENLDLDLAFSNDTENLKKYGFFEFVKAIVKEKEVDADLFAELLATYNPKTRQSVVRERTVKINRGALAAALNVPKNYVDAPGEDYMPPVDPNDQEYAIFLLKFVLKVVYLSSGTNMSLKIYQMVDCIMKGHPKFFDLSKFIWMLVEHELKQGVDIRTSYYSRHLQCLIRSQHPDLCPVVEDGGGQPGVEAEIVDGSSKKISKRNIEPEKKSSKKIKGASTSDPESQLERLGEEEAANSL